MHNVMHIHTFWVQCNQPTVCVYFITRQVNNRYNAGDYAGSENASQQTKKWSKISIIVGSICHAISIGSVLAYVIFVVAVGVGSAASATTDFPDY